MSLTIPYCLLCAFVVEMSMGSCLYPLPCVLTFLKSFPGITFNNLKVTPAKFTVMS